MFMPLTKAGVSSRILHPTAVDVEAKKGRNAFLYCASDKLFVLHLLHNGG